MASENSNGNDPPIDYLFSVVYYRSGSVSITFITQKRRPKAPLTPYKRRRLDFLNAHNKYRRMHGVPELELDEELCEYAQDWADLLAKVNSLQCRKRPRYGENIVCMYSSNPNYRFPGRLPVDTWYEEKSDYRFGEESHSLKTVHFTQMVWKSTKKLGVGWARSRQGYMYVVADYYPSGNRLGEYVNNVPDVCCDGSQVIKSEPTSKKPERQRPVPAPDDITEAIKKAQEVIRFIDKIAEQKQVPASIPNAVGWVKQKAEEMVKTIDKIKTETEHVNDISDLNDAKQKAQEVAQAVENIEPIAKEPNIVEEVKQKATEVANAVDKLEAEREHAIHMPEVVNEAIKTAQEVMATIEEIDTNQEQVENMPDIFEKVKQTAQEVVQAVEKIDEERAHVQQIPVYVDKIKQTTEDMAQTIDKMKQGGKPIQAVPTTVDETEQKAQEMVQAIEKIENDEGVSAAKQITPASEAVQKAKEVIQVIDQIGEQKPDPESIPKAVEEVKQKAEEMIQTIDKIKTETEHVNDISDLNNAKQKAQEIAQAVENIEPIAEEPNIVEEVKQKATEVANAVEKLEAEREHAIHMPEVVNEAVKTAQEVMATIEEIDVHPEQVENMPDIFEKIKQTAQEVVQAAEKIEEERAHVEQIPVYVDKIKQTTEDIAQTIDKMKQGGQPIQSIPTTVDEAEQKTREMVQAIEKIENDEGVSVVKQIPPKQGTSDVFNEECLKAHNEYRDMHGTPPLKLSPSLTEFAQRRAEELANGITPDEDNEYGENVYYAESDDPNSLVSGFEPVDSWYEESYTYNFDVEPSNSTEAHFTQVIWKGSTDLGIGVSKADGKTVIVCNYNPAGNVIGQFRNNVAPVGGVIEKKGGSKAIVGSLETVPKPSGESKGLVGSLEPKPISKEQVIFMEDNFIENFLKAHNTYRIQHGAPALILDDDICKYAQEWADTLAEKNSLENRPGSKYGANLYSTYSSEPHFKIQAHVPVDRWYDEKKKYDFTNEPTGTDVLHFTQLVWKSTTKLGVGCSQAKNGYIYLVANYQPPGNVQGRYLQNVSDIVDEQAAKKSGSPLVAQDVNSLDKYPSDGEYTPFQLYSLDVHNEYRKKHGVPPLALNKQICDFAKSWAEENVKAEKMYHRPDNEYGENLYTMYSSDYTAEPSAREVVKAWYDEIEDYNFDTEDVNPTTLHFTQVIWRNSTEVGVDMAKDGNGNSYVVANYKPRGNVMTKFKENVPRPLEGPYLQ